MEDKKNVDAYLSKYQIREVLNVAVNKVLRELPLQPLSHLAEALTADSCQAYGILSVTAREVLDASGFPTVLCDVRTPRGVFTGASGGIISNMEGHSPHSWDNRESRYSGRGVSDCVGAINRYIGPALVGRDPAAQEECDSCVRALVSSDALSGVIGAQGTLAVSIALARAGAAHANRPLFEHIAQLCGSSPSMPIPAVSMVKGGTEEDNDIAFEDFLVIPVGAETYSEALRVAVETRSVVQGNLRKRFGKARPAASDSGAFAPVLSTAEEVLGLLSVSVEAAGYTDRVKFGIRVSADQFYVSNDVLRLEADLLAKGGSRERARVKGRKLPGALGETAQVMYDMAFKQSLRAALAPPAAAIATGALQKSTAASTRSISKGDTIVSSGFSPPHRSAPAVPERDIIPSIEYLRSLEKLCADFPIAFLEDPTRDEDSCASLTTSSLGKRLLISSKRRTRSSLAAIDAAVASKSSNSLTLDISWCSCLWDVIQIARTLTAMGWSLNICLPEIDVDDTCVADVAVGLGAALFLGGSPVGTNAAKYSRLLCIEDTLGPRASLSRVPSISGGK